MVRPNAGTETALERARAEAVHDAATHPAVSCTTPASPLGGSAGPVAAEGPRPILAARLALIQIKMDGGFPAYL